MQRSKYGAKKTAVDGIRFDSKAEARRWCELVAMEKAGRISELARQVPFELAPKVKYTEAARATPALRMVVDFVYRDESGSVVYEDCKGVVTEGARIKRHLMMAAGKEVRFLK